MTDPVLFSSQAVSVETASRDGGRPAEQADTSLSGGENYGQLIQRQESRKKNKCIAACSLFLILQERTLE